MIDIRTEGKVIYTTATGKLDEDDYNKVVPQLEMLIREYDKIRWYFEMNDFEGWEASAFWKDMKFDIKHTKDLERIAMVGDERWEKWLASVMKPFTPAMVRFFTVDQKAEAKEWIRQAT